MTISTVDYALMAGAAYESTRGTKNKIPYPSVDGWQYVAQYSQRSLGDGFEASAFRRGNEVVISFAGTSGTVDWLTNGLLGVGLTSTQLLDAAVYYEDIKNTNPGATISFTGHSLGGGLASLMGVFFNKQAVTFDQAPFRGSASIANQALIAATLLAEGYGVDSDLATFYSVSIAGIVAAIRGESNVSTYTANGEALTNAIFNALRIGSIFVGPNGVGSDTWLKEPIDLHAQQYLIALLQSKSFLESTNRLAFLERDIFDPTLFAADTGITNTDTKDFLTNLIRYEFGIPGTANSDLDLLTKFGNDTSKLGSFVYASDAVKEPLLKILMNYYYEKEVASADIPKEFFINVSGGLQFDLTQPMGETALSGIKGYSDLVTWIAQNAPQSVTNQINTFLADPRRITLGLSANIDAQAPNDSISDFMLSGFGGGHLNGNGGDDLLVGGAGIDYLDGGIGNDTLVGGSNSDVLVGGGGADTYFYTTGDGNDVIDDTQGSNELKINDAVLGAFVKIEGTNFWQKADDVDRIVKLGPTISEIKNTDGSLGLAVQLNDGTGNVLLLNHWSPTNNFSITLAGTVTVSPPANAPVLTIGNGLISEDNYWPRFGYNVDPFQQSLYYDASLYLGNYYITPSAQDHRPYPYVYAADGITIIPDRAGTFTFGGSKQNDTLIGMTHPGLAVVPAGTLVFRDFLSGHDGRDVIYGDEKNGINGDADMLVGGRGSDYLFGGAGSDFLFAQEEYWVPAFENGALRTWTNWTQADIDREALAHLSESENVNDTDYLDGGEGSDNLFGGSYNDTLLGGGGHDLIVAGAGADFIQAGNGIDDGITVFGDSFYKVNLIGGSPVISMEPISATSIRYRNTFNYNDTIIGGAGIDIIDGEIGDDLIVTGAGNDIVTGDRTNSREFWAYDEKRSAFYALYVPLEASLHGNDKIFSGAGNDTVLGNGGNDLIDGGDGDDTLAGDELSSSTTIYGDDTILGGAGNDYLYGGGGNDLLFGGDGNDRLFDGAGNDVLQGGRGNDTLDGGAGSDTYLFVEGDGVDGIFDSDRNLNIQFSSAITGVIQGYSQVEIHYGANDAVVLSPEIFAESRISIQGAAFNAQDWLTPVNGALYGSGNDERLTTTETVHSISGGGGNDTIVGGGQSDTLSGGNGDDFIEAGEGDDFTDLGAGSDTADAGAGRDVMYGDSSDTIVYRRGNGYDEVNGVGNIVFDASIHVSDISYSRNQYDLDMIIDGDYKNMLVVKNYFSGSITNFIFESGETAPASFMADGVYLDRARPGEDERDPANGPFDIGGSAVGGKTGGIFQAQVQQWIGLYGTSHNDYLVAPIDATGYAPWSSLSNQRMGGWLEGYAGNDILVSNRESDYLVGGEGSDTYVFNQQFGVDVIDESGASADVDKIVFGPGISSSDILIGADLTNSSLVIFSQSERSTLAVRDMASIERIEFSDGTIWDATFIQQRLAGSQFSVALTDWDNSNIGYQTHGTAFSQTVNGSAADDFLISASSDWSSVSSGGGNDHVLLLRGTGYVMGEAGNDWIETGDANDQLDGGDGNDTLFGGSGNDLLLGGDGSDSLVGSDGDDQLDGGVGIDTMSGGIGNDTYFVDNVNDLIVETVGGGLDRVSSSVSYTLTADVEVLVLVADTGPINGSGNDADNIICGNNFSNTLQGGKGSDTYKIYNVAGCDVIENFDANGSVSIDEINLGEGINSGDVSLIKVGDDLIIAFGVNAVRVRNQFLNENYAVDRISFADGSVWLAADINAKMIVQGVPSDGGDLLVGSESSDTISALSGNDTVFGWAGDDLLDGGSGADTLIGSVGNDTYFLDVIDDVVIENADEGIDTINTAITYTLDENLENLTLTGTDAINGIGNTLDNVLIGNSAANTLTGGAGNDALNGGAGADRLVGGTGNDTYYIDVSSDVIVENASEGTDTVLSAFTYTLGSNLENLTLSGVAAINGAGNTLNNTIIGNTASNTLSGGAGADTLIGAAGDDSYVVDNVGDIVTENTGEGMDSVSSSVTYTLSTSVENLTLTGTTAINGTGNASNNVMVGNSAINTLTGAAGDDVIDGAAGADKLIGGTGNDTYYIDNTGDVVTENASEGVDIVNSAITYTLVTNLENLTLTGTAAISGTGNAVANIINGNTGANVLDGGVGADTLIGGTGNDTYVIDDVGDVVVETSALITEIDLVQSAISYTLGANLEKLTLTGVASNNGVGNTLNNTLTGNAGNNVLDGGLGNDTLVGGSGDDTYIVDSASDVVTEAASAGIDLIQSAVTYTLSTNVENLTLIGTAAINGTGNTVVNILTGNSGNNALDGGTGADTLIGGLGNDVYVVDNVGDVITENGNEGTDAVNSSVTYTLSSNVENLTLTGTAAINATGNASNNTLTGNTAVNILTGGAGDDVLNGGTGADTMLGGIGNDTFFVDNAGDVVTENASEGIDTVNSSLTYTLGTNTENLILTGTTAINGTGNASNNVITGNGAVNTLTGGAGDDVLDGLAGADRMVGGTGNDTYAVDISTDVIVENASEGTDTVNSAITYTLGANLENLTLTGTTAINGTGNSVANVLTGNSANNTLTGAAGNDTYVFGRGGAADTIVDTDSTAGNTDVLSVLSGVATDQLWFRHVGNNLEVSIIGTSDTETISNWYSGSANHIEQFKTSDGKVLLDSQVENLVSAMAAFSPPSAGQTTLPQIYQDSLNTVIAANWH